MTTTTTMATMIALPATIKLMGASAAAVLVSGRAEPPPPPPPLPAVNLTSLLLQSRPPLLRPVDLQGQGGDEAVDVDLRDDNKDNTTINPPCLPQRNRLWLLWLGLQRQRRWQQ